jgi:hypothetical protein
MRPPEARKGQEAQRGDSPLKPTKGMQSCILGLPFFRNLNIVLSPMVIYYSSSRTAST